MRKFYTLMCQLGLLNPNRTDFRTDLNVYCQVYHYWVRSRYEYFANSDGFDLQADACNTEIIRYDDEHFGLVDRAPDPYHHRLFISYKHLKTSITSTSKTPKRIIIPIAVWTYPFTPFQMPYADLTVNINLLLIEVCF